jgi:hypothetical protein
MSEINTDMSEYFEADGTPRILGAKAESELTQATGSAPPRFYWKQCYELGDRLHWALCDTQTDSEAPPNRVSCLEMILLDHHSLELQNKLIPKLIIELLNAHFAKAQNDPSSATRKPMTKPIKRGTKKTARPRSLKRVVRDHVAKRHRTRKCQACGGAGGRQTKPFWITAWIPCEKCKGTGYSVVPNAPSSATR